jgi:hypothetical protein
MNNPYFSKSLRLLAHPLSLAAIGLMLANDAIFKNLWPSWWTGKLSDFAGLFFLPFLAAALLSLFAPGRRVGGLAFGITGAGFALMKLEPWLGPILGGLGLQARADPSDLLALLSLLPAGWMWRTVKAGPVMRLSWRLLALPLAALVTLADAAAPDMGVVCLQASDGAILASTAYYPQSFVSSDGGLSWQSLAGEGSVQCSPNQPDIPVLKSAAGDVEFWISRGKGIERSLDGGKTWTMDFSINGYSEQEQTYVRMTRPGNLMFTSGPYAAMIDPSTGNLVLAMGQEGVLVRNPGGQYTWVAVGTYQHDSLKEAGATGVALLLQYQIWLAALVGLGWLFTRAVRQLGKGKVWVILGWIGLGVTSFVATPQVASDSYLGIASIGALFFMSAATVIALLVAAIRLRGEAYRLFGRSLLQMAALAAACLLPYVLWGTSVLSQYWIAIAASAGLVVVLMVFFSVGKSVNPKEGAART